MVKGENELREMFHQAEAPHSAGPPYRPVYRGYSGVSEPEWVASAYLYMTNSEPTPRYVQE